MFQANDKPKIASFIQEILDNRVEPTDTDATDAQQTKADELTVTVEEALEFLLKDDKLVSQFGIVVD